MTPEQRAWEAIRPTLVSLGLDPKRVENILGPGHPDVDYTHGNIELKELASFPKRADTVVKIETFTGEQAGWLGQRWAKGGLSWLMVRVGREWFLFDGWTALNLVFKDGLNEQGWRENACMVYPGKPTWGASPDREGWHSYGRQLADWLRFDLARLMPHARAHAMRLRAMKTPQQLVNEMHQTHPVSIGRWSVLDLKNTEQGRSPTRMLDDLLWYWEQ